MLLQRSRGSFNNNLPPCPLLEHQGVAIWSSTIEASGLRYNMQLCPNKNMYKKKDKTLFFIVKFTHIATSILLQSFQSSKSLTLEHLELYQTFFTKVCIIFIILLLLFKYYYYYYYYFVFMSAYKGCL